MKILSKEISHRIIIRNLFSFVAIITLFSLSSCVTPSSVRGKKVYGNEHLQSNNEDRLDKRKKVDDKDEELDSEEFAKLMEEANKINPPKELNNDNSQNKANDVSSLLLPLNKQIENLTKDQTEIKKSINSINVDMNYVKSDIAEIKETLRMMSNKNYTASTGAEDIEKENSRKKDKFVLKSDEAVQKENENKAKTENKPFTIKANPPSVKQNKTTETPKTDIAKNETKEVEIKSSNGQVSDLNKLSFELTENYLQNKDYAKALTKLKEIESGLNSTLEKSKHNYLMGESHFGLQQYQKAIEYFIKVLESSEFEKKEDAKVMIAEAQIRNGQTDSAKETFKQLIAEFPKSEHIPRARKMLQKL